MKTKTTYVRLTFGFNKNKLGHSAYYRRGEGKSFSAAVKDLFIGRGNNFLPEEQRKEITKQILDAAKENESFEPQKNN